MKMALKIDDLDPDGVLITINWETMDVGWSFFIPCLDVEKAQLQLKEVEKLKNWKFKTQTCVENKKLGLRVWRTM
jgi:hypothetical protein|tara:strand:+ start:1048 stop:1272 length:225 start_codon:yes stop_codon:yes gene_type:complete